MASRPSSKPNWVSDAGALKQTEPTAPKKLEGWTSGEKPAFQYMNYLFYILSEWLHFFAGQQRYNIIIDSDSDEADYATLALYIADSPAAGDRVLLKVDELLAVKMTLPAGIELTVNKGVKFTTVTDLAEMLEVGNETRIIGDCELELSHTGTIAECFILNGNDIFIENLIINNASTGTVTDAVKLEASKNGIKANCLTIAGSGTITNPLDSAANTETANEIIVRSR